MGNRERIIETLRNTQRENIETVIEYMENHHFFDRGCHCHLRYIVHKADCESAKRYKSADEE